MSSSESLNSLAIVMNGSNFLVFPESILFK